MSTTRLKFAPIVVCLAFGLAACGDDSKSTDTSVDNSDTTVPEVAVSASDVQLADSSFGQIVVDGDGNTLYLFTSDSAGTVTCTGGCAGAWPGLAPHGTELVIDGPDDSLFSIVTGADGGPQVAFNGHPLYLFGGDSAPGDTNGQGSGGVWFVVDADGNAITD